MKKTSKMATADEIWAIVREFALGQKELQRGQREL